MQMEAIKESMQKQMQVRQNAEEFRNTLNELYSWEKDIKDREKELLHNPAAASNEKEHLKTLPVRSHAAASAEEQQQQTTPTTSCSIAKLQGSEITPKTPTIEKSEQPLNANEEKRKQANEIKARGNKHVQLAEYEKAIDEYSRAIEVYPEDTAYYTNRALCYLKLERFDKCIVDCDHAIAIDSLCEKAYYRRMQANESLGNNMDALKDCTTVLMINPKNREGKSSLERINDRLHKNIKSPTGANFSMPRENLIDILTVEKPAYKRSQKPLIRVPIADVTVPKNANSGDNLQISDEDIDKLFNSNCGPFVEVKEPKTKTAALATTTTKNAVQNTKSSNISSSEQNIVKETVKTHEASVMDSNKISTINKQVSLKESDSNEQLLMQTNRPLPAAPTSTAQFYSNWKELQAPQKYQYLKSIEIANLCKILGAGFDSDTLTDIIYILHDYYLLKQELVLADTLLEVSKNNQIGILSLLMSTAERKALTEILNSIKENKTNAATAQLISKNFNLC